MTLVSDLRENINDVLSIRDELGAAKQPVALVTRTWSGTEPGDGTFTDASTPVVPSPSILAYTDDYRIKEGGAVQQGDIKLKWISKQSFPDRAAVECAIEAQNIEKFYSVGGFMYRVIQVEEKLLSWNVLLRKVSKQ